MNSLGIMRNVCEIISDCILFNESGDLKRREILLEIISTSINKLKDGGFRTDVLFRRGNDDEIIFTRIAIFFDNLKITVDI